MKRLMITLTVLLVLTGLTFGTFAEGPKSITEKDVKNLSTAIQSDNEGLKRSAIFFAGYYKISELSEILLDELTQPVSPQTKILIALALYEIGDTAVLNQLADLALNEDEDIHVRNMAAAISIELKDKLLGGITAVK